MNYDKIKELANEAGFLVDMFGVGIWDSEEFHKFAELIVKECGNVLDIGCSHPYNSVIPKLKDHFGIE